ncbi:MAG: UxaA family hydrolase, partial [Caldilineaceae bacterium]|nr:UxaA family hydrolase [Caldilineaceae bacterium]
MPSFPFSAVARLPLPGDNVAIATQRLEKGTEITTESDSFALDATVLEGHRFAIEPIAAGKQLLSWQMPFGTAAVGIEPGQYVCNDGMLEALAGRAVQMDLPATPNFESEIPPFVLDAESFQPGKPVPVKPVPDTFMGYPRTGGRGSGTRNVILLLGTSSLAGGFVRALEAKLQADADALDNVDAIVAVAHTEGAVPDPNNLELVLRTLAGFVIHPNAAAVLAVDHGTEPVNNRALAAWMADKGYPVSHVKHEFLSLSGTFE